MKEKETQLLLSIIVPVYNVEKYIFKCLNSIFSQTVDNSLYEVIVVNDGTPDNSMQIVEQFVRSHSNLYIINQKNQGLSAARNAGLSIAKGQYIWFVDSDDWISEKSVEIIQNNLCRNCDCLALNVPWVSETTGEEIPVAYFSLSELCQTGPDFLKKNLMVTPIQRFIISRSVLTDNGLLFHVGMIHEDEEFSPRLLYFIKCIYVISEPLYFYLKRGGDSITSSISHKSIEGIYTALSSVWNFTMNINSSSEIKKIYFDRCYILLEGLFDRYIIYIYKNQDISMSIVREYSQTIEKIIKSLNLNLKGKREKIHLFLYLHFPVLYLYYKIKKTFFLHK